MQVENKNGTSNFDKLVFYFKVSLIGMLRGASTLILEHPLDSIKTQWQDQIKIKSKIEMINTIYNTKGIMGFYNGFVPNFIRVTSKNFYRWPFMIFLPKFYDNTLPEKLKLKFQGLNKILTGLTIANIEILFMCPLDRLKVFLMTSTNLSHNTSKLNFFYTTNKNNFIYELFRGLEPSFWRSNVSWVSFLYFDYKFKKIYKDFKKNDNLNFFDIFFISIGVGIVNVFMSTIFIFILF